MERMAISRPDISFRLIVNNQTKLHSSGNHKVKDLLYQLYGREITSNLLPIKAELPGLKLSGFIGKPILARGNRNYEHYFINGRYVRSNIISKAIEDAYQGRLMQHKYPFTVIYLTIEPDQIDVNVHPTKMELRFADNEQVYRDVYNAVTAAFAGKELIPEVKMDSDDKGNSGNSNFNNNTSNKGDGGKSAANAAVTADAAEKSEVKIAGTGGTSDAKAAGTEGKSDGKTGGGKLPENRPEPFEQNRIANLLRETGGYKTTAKPEYSKTENTKSENTKPEYSKESSKESFNNFVNSPAAKKLEAENGNTQSRPAGPLPIGEPVKNPRAGENVTSRQLPTDNEATTQKVTVNSDRSAGVPSAPTASDIAKDIHPQKKSPEQLSFFEEKLLTQTARMKYRFIGQLFDTYWLIQSGDELMIMDQHAAHEKVLFERFMDKLKTKTEIYSQAMNPPAIITLSAVEEDLLNQHREEFLRMGFEIEHFGGREYALYGVPADLPRIKPQDFFKDILDGLSDCGVSDSNMILETIASMSCKAAVKGNHAMSLPEAEKLVDELMTLKNPFACPHGRPTIIRMSKYELEKKFSRII